MNRQVPHFARLISLAMLITLPSIRATAEVEHVRNTEPAHPPRTVQLEESWRVGGDDGELLFGAIVEAISDPDGNVYLLDHHLKQVEVIAPDGEHLRTLSREGDGPGEIRNPRDMVYLPDGRIGLAELFPSKLITLTREGVPRATINLGTGGSEPETGFRATLSCSRRGDTFLFAGQHSVPSDTGQDRVQSLCMLDATGKETARLREATTVLDFAKGVLVEKEILRCFLLVNAVGPDGRVYVPRDRETYAIEVYAPDGTLERVIERDLPNRKRTEREMRRIRTVFEATARQIEIEIQFDVEPTNQLIADLFVDSENRLWVQHARSGDDPPDGVLMRYDLFDPSGQYLQEMHIACEGNAAFDGIEFLPDWRALLIKGYVLAQWETFDTSAVNWGEEEDTGAMEVVCYEIRF